MRPSPLICNVIRPFSSPAVGHDQFNGTGHRSDAKGHRPWLTELLVDARSECPKYHQWVLWMSSALHNQFCLENYANLRRLNQLIMRWGRS